MPYKPNSIYEVGETGNWNIASDYSRLIFKHFADADMYERLATLGATDIFEAFSLGKTIKAESKVEGFRWLLFTLKQIISDTIFAIVKKDDIELIELFKLDLEFIEKNISLAYKEVSSAKTGHDIKTIVINESVFTKLLNMLSKIKQELKRPLNRAELIYIPKEEFDPDKFKAEIAEDLINSG